MFGWTHDDTSINISFQISDNPLSSSMVEFLVDMTFLGNLVFQLFFDNCISAFVGLFANSRLQNRCGICWYPGNLGAIDKVEFFQDQIDQLELSQMNGIVFSTITIYANIVAERVPSTVTVIACEYS
jgi:hypothetical protein